MNEKEISIKTKEVLQSWCKLVHTNTTRQSAEFEIGPYHFKGEYIEGKFSGVMEDVLNGVIYSIERMYPVYFSPTDSEMRETKSNKGE